MNRFLMITASVVIGVVISQVFFNNSPSNSSTSEPAEQQQKVAESGEKKALPSSQSSPQPPKINSGLISIAPANAKAYIIEPINGATLSSPVTIKFGIENMAIAKAGDNVENSGHHHLLIDLEQLPDLTKPLPANEQLIHFGGAQTETTIELAKGSHTLQLLLGNHLHIPHDKPVLSEKISITVE